MDNEKPIIEALQNDIKLYKKTDQDCLKLDILNTMENRISELMKNYNYLKTPAPYIDSP